MNRHPRLPTAATLARYGLPARRWTQLAGDRCRICERPWGDKVSPVVDHEHVAGWKKMGPEDRRLYVRGVICRSCNHFVLTRFGTPLKHRNAATYLEEYDGNRADRRP